MLKKTMLSIGLSTTRPDTFPVNNSKTLSFSFAYQISSANCSSIDVPLCRSSIDGTTLLGIAGFDRFLV
jgi:hypothetical protein